MPLALVAANIAGSAYMIGQEYTVRSTRGRRVGTTAMFNCMGVVLHSPRHRIGCLAHIEYVANSAAYLSVFQDFVIYMKSKITKYGGVDPGLQAGLFGNASGARDAAFTDQLRNSLILAGIASAEISDQRLHFNQGPYFSAGAAPRLNGAFPSIAYDPATGQVDCYTQAMAPAHSDAWWGIRAKKLQ